MSNRYADLERWIDELVSGVHSYHLYPCPSEPSLGFCLGSFWGRRVTFHRQEGAGQLEWALHSYSGGLNMSTTYMPRGTDGFTKLEELLNHLSREFLEGKHFADDRAESVARSEAFLKTNALPIV